MCDGSPGASSTAVHVVYLSDDTRLVLRRYLWPGFLDEEPVAPRREVDALRFALGHGLVVPEVIAADVSGHEVGDGVPSLLMTFLPGRAVAAPDVAQLAEVAAAIHAVDADDLGHAYSPWYHGTIANPPAAATWPARWETAIGLWFEAMPPYRPTFIHRDFHPGNVLWSRGRPTGVVDWANACRGPRGCDLAHCRTNLVDWAGGAAADEFLDVYASSTGEDLHPYWELASILESDPAGWTADSVAEVEPRLAQAVGAMTTLPGRR